MKIAGTRVGFNLLASLVLIPASLNAAEGGAEAPASTFWIVGSLVMLTLVLVGWFVLVSWGRRRILNWLRELAISKTTLITSQRLRRVSVHRFLQLARGLTRLASATLMLGGLFFWATAVLNVFPKTRPFAVQVEQAILSKTETLAMNAAASLPDLAVVVLIYFITRIVHQLLGVYFKSVAEGEIESPIFDAVTAETTLRLLDLGIWILATIIAFPYLPGSGSAAFRGISVLAGLMLTLGSTNVVSQFTSGLALIYGRAVRPGDYIETSQAEGVVEHVGLFACTLRTPQDEVVVLPHSAVSSGLKNMSRAKDGVRFTTTVTIGYDTPWRQVSSLLLGAADDTAGIRKEPAPVVRRVALEDFYVKYELQVTPERPTERKPVLSALNTAILDRFHAAGVQIMSPHYRSDPPEPKVPAGKPEETGKV